MAVNLVEEGPGKDRSARGSSTGVIGVYIADDVVLPNDRFEDMDDLDVSLCNRGAGARLDRLALVCGLFLPRSGAASVTAGKPP